MTPVQVGGFDDVDRSGEAGALVEWMTDQRAGASARQAEQLGAQRGERVLDLGCGPGTDLAFFAETVGEKGMAVGVDRSGAMVQTARCSGLVQCADVAAIGLRSEQFDAVWIRAVLLHVPSPTAALGEALRLLRPGGRLVAMEPDHGTHIVGSADADVFERVRQHRFTKFQNPRVGRSLKDLLVTAGFVGVRARPAMVHFDDFEVARASGGPFDRAVEDAVADGAITQEEGRSYLDQLALSSVRGGFFFSAASIVAIGRRPS